MELKLPKLTAGSCYENAYRLMDANDVLQDGVVAHGYPILAKPPHCLFGHAWIELGSLCVDWMSVHDRIAVVRASTYYEVGKINPEWVTRYEYGELLLSMLEHNIYGPFPDAVEPDQEVSWA